MSNSIRRTFRELFSDPAFSCVVIPIIQRDYAQGRASAQEIRTQFLDVLWTTLSLPPDAPQLPLDLDFVYGSLDEPAKAFCPLDGQQRLTTLFLLHWYLACRDGNCADFQEWMRSGNMSRFTYMVRPSSQEFFNELVGTPLDLSALLPADTGHSNELSKTIMDSPWFFLFWRQDPTILSALEMLDAIHMQFKESRGFYNRLAQSQAPYITFQFLNLRDFNLSDELYIKMNARGKPLTAFDAFKARMEQHIDNILPEDTRTLNGTSISLRTYFSHRVDSTWPDLFWRHRDRYTNVFDQQFMNFVRAVALVLYPHGRGEMDRGETIRVLDSLSTFSSEYSFYSYQKNNCVTPEFIKGLIIILDGLTTNKPDSITTYLHDVAYYNENDMFAGILAGKASARSYTGLIQFYAYCAYRIKYPHDIPEAHFYEWMRLIANLSNNTIYNRVDEFYESLLEIRRLLDDIASAPVLEYISDASNPISSFYRQQIREERLKAQLMRRNAEWRSLILAAETHGYFRGQIEFLLKFTGVLDRWLVAQNCDWSDAEDAGFRDLFASYYEKAAAVFGPVGLVDFANSLWERALLSVGNFLLPVKQNLSFLENGTRDATWKRLLRGSDKSNDAAEEKRELVKVLLDRIDYSRITDSLQAVIDSYLQSPDPNEQDEWRRMIIECPRAISFCQKRQIRIVDNGTIYLLSKLQMNSIHAELSTFHLKECLLDPKAKRGELDPFTVSYLTVSNEYAIPHAYLSWPARKLWLNIVPANGQYELVIQCHSETMLPDRLKEALVSQHGLIVGQDGSLSLSVTYEVVSTVLDQIVSTFREFIAQDIPSGDLIDHA